MPPKAELKILERANMAIARTPPQVANPLDYLGDHAEFGPALFSKLVPFSVHVAISIYEERRDRLVNQNIIQELENLTDKIHTLLSSIGLPGSLQALEKPLGLPPNLIQHAEEIRQADAINKIQRSFADIEKLRANDWAIFEEGKAALAAEEEEDEQLRRKYGTSRWRRPESQADPDGAKFWAAINEIGGYFQNSASSDEAVREKFLANKELLEILSGSNQSLMNYVPSSTPVETSGDLKAAVGRLRSVYNDVLRMETRRRKKVESLREAARRDDIKPDILKEAARLERAYPSTPLQTVHFEEFFEKRLDKLYEPELEALEKEAQDQENLLTLVERANREFDAQKRLIDAKGHRDREQVLQKLNGAYFKYKEIVANLEVGRKFYNDLNRIVAHGFRDAVKAWVAERRLEAQRLEEYVVAGQEAPCLAKVFADTHPGNLICRRSRLSTSTTTSLLRTCHQDSQLSLRLTHLPSSIMTDTSLHTSSRRTNSPPINSSRCSHNNSINSHSQHRSNSPCTPDQLFRVRPRRQYNRGPEARCSRLFRSRNHHSLGNSQTNCLERGIPPWASSLEGHRLEGHPARREHGVPVRGFDSVEAAYWNDA